MQDVAEQEIRDSYRISTSNSSFSGNRGGGAGANTNGFVVQGGPWEQRAPNTASVTDFPAFGGGRRGIEQQEPQAPPTGVWGARR